jgi:glycerol uptake facilitator-like aquaporin
VSSSLQKQLGAEFTGTAILVGAVVGSGIMGERLAAGNAAVALLANSVATGAVLLALILTFSPISGAHFNPLVTLTASLQRELTTSGALARAGSQILGGLAGVAVANTMFDLPMFFASQHVRSGFSQLLAEAIATFGLIAVARLSSSALAIAGYIVGAYWFTSSTSFANPAVTIARTVTDTFSGIRPQDAPGFLVAQTAGCAAAALFCRWLTLGEKKAHVL